MADAVEKLTTGEPLSIDQLIEYLPALKEVARAQLENWAKGAAVLHRFRKGEIVCEEGEFGSTAYYIVSGNVDIFINNPLAHLRTRPQSGFFGRRFARMKSFLTDDTEDRRAEAGQRRFIGIDANVDLPMHRPLAQLGPGDLFGEMTCRTYQPRSATVQAREPCVMVEMLRVILDMLVGNRQVSEASKATSKVKMPTFKGTSFKTELENKYRERSLNNHLRSVPLFATVSEEFLQRLKENVELVSYNQGQHGARGPSDAGRRNGTHLSKSRRLFRRNRFAPRDQTHGHLFRARCGRCGENPGGRFQSHARNISGCTGTTRAGGRRAYGRGSAESNSGRFAVG
jgi:CRP-like cAMP-binding protein